MDRRAFLAAAAGVAAGCARGPGPAGGVTPLEAEHIAAARQSRDRHLRELARFRVPADAKRTTAPPPADVLQFAPELKPLTKVAIRLHPRYSDEPAPDESKLGGQFLWPAAEPWPTCDEHKIPFVPVLQLRAEDAPPNWPYRPGTDLAQLLWCARDHGEGWVKPHLAWRKRSAVAGPLAEPPPTDAAVLDYAPVPCRLFPERVTEFPNFEALPGSVRQKVGDGKPGGPTEYIRLLSVAPGTKVGGYPQGIQGPEVPACPKCRWGMDYLLTVASEEWGEERWIPLEERAARDERGYRGAAGLRFPYLGRVHLFACRRCDGWPVRAVGQT
jgi:hypothetical protein